jgi:Xaa-Pro aminopeptidase
MRASILDSDPRGKTVSQVRNDFDMAVRSAVSGHPTLHGFQGCRVFMTSGGTIGPNTARDDTVVTEGDVIWMDCGVTVDGYQADIGRTVALGSVDPLTRRIADALAAGGSAGYERLAVGTAMNEVFAATQDAVRKNGLGTYTRGHVGHAIGTGGGEHHPFISPQEAKTFEPGMVFAFERPFYLRGHGGFQFEDNLVVHEDRIEVLNVLPQGLLISG